MIILLWPFIIVAGVALTVLSVVHFSAVFDLTSPVSDNMQDVIYEGILWLAIPFVLSVYIVAKDFLYEQKLRWFWSPPPLRVLLQGCPLWMKYLTYGLSCLAVIEFVAGFRPEVVGSAILMSIYWVFMSTMYSAVQVYKSVYQSR
jgi:hypothetical protein